MRVLLTIAVVLCASLASAQTPAAGTENLVWDQAAASAAQAQSYTYLVADGAAAPATLPGVTCSGAASPFVCAARLPALTTGLHSLTLAARIIVNNQPLTSAASAPLSLLIMAVPAVPQNVRIG